MTRQPALQLTLALLKPDVVANPMALRDIQHTLLRNNFLIVRSRMLRLSRAHAEQFYAEHRGRFFYERLVSHVSSGRLHAHVLAHCDAVALWRALLGPTRVLQTVYSAPHSIRGRHGLTDTRNAAHGSDSARSADQEIRFFFPDFDPEQWYREHELAFRIGTNITFDCEKLEHITS